MSALPLLLLSGLLQISPVEARFAEIEAASKGRLGAAIITSNSAHYSRRAERFSIQSVMKLVVSMAALDEVDRGKWKTGQKFTFRRSDRSVSVQPLAEKLGRKSSVTVSLEECIELTVTQSCCAAGDFLIRKMGGTQVVNAFLKKNHIVGLSVDRQERDLQTNILGLRWKPEYVEAAILDRDIERVPEADKHAAYRRYQTDRRDTTTPEAMGLLLQKLITGKLLSKASTRYLLGVMDRTQTGPKRLKAGVPAGWKLGHKTGTSSTDNGVAAATNDVGIARRSNGDWIVIVALLGDSTANADERDLTICQVAKAAFPKP